MRPFQHRCSSGTRSSHHRQHALWAGLSLVMLVSGCDWLTFPMKGTVGSIVGDCRPIDGGCTRAHHGYDIGGDRKKVYAAQDGVVVKVRNNCYSQPGSDGCPGAGNQIVIKHDNGYYTKYFHLFDAKVDHGERVHQNEYIADSGGTGGNYAPHLHFEIYDTNWQQHFFTRIVIHAGNDRHPWGVYPNANSANNQNDWWTPIKTMPDGAQARLININDIVSRGGSWDLGELIAWDVSP